MRNLLFSSFIFWLYQNKLIIPNKIIAITVILFVLNIECEKTGIEDNKDLVIMEKQSKSIVFIGKVALPGT